LLVLVESAETGQKAWGATRPRKREQCQLQDVTVRVPDSGELLPTPMRGEMPEPYVWLDLRFWEEQLQIPSLTSRDAWRMRTESYLRASDLLDGASPRVGLCRRFEDPLLILIHLEFARQYHRYRPRAPDRGVGCVRELAASIAKSFSGEGDRQWEHAMREILCRDFTYQERLAWFFSQHEFTNDEIALLLELSLHGTEEILADLQRLFDCVDEEVVRLCSRQRDEHTAVAPSVMRYACESWVLGPGVIRS